MKQSRREFLQVAGLFAAAASTPSLALGNPLDYLPSTRMLNNLRGWPILQGATDATSTTLLLLHPQPTSFAVKIIGSRGEELPYTWIDRWPLPGSSLTSSELRVDGLEVGIEYHLQVVSEGGRTIDERTFGALDLNRESGRFAVVSCMNDFFGDKAVSMWRSLQREKCDFVIFLGDTCYSDFGNFSRDEAGYARRYAETRSQLAWFRMPRLTPSFAVWDDHDFGQNNGDSSFPRAAFMRQLFRRFWGSAGNSAWRPAHGVGSSLAAFGQRFYLMDGRSFRDAPDQRTSRLWGQEQADWLIEDLSRTERPAWLMNGGQFFGAYLGKDSFEGNYADDFLAFRQRLARVSAPVVFASGDVHFSEAMEIEEKILGYRTHEFTSSSMHSFNFPFRQHFASNPRRLASEWRHNFQVFNVNVGGGRWQIHDRCVMNGGYDSFSLRVEINRA